MNLYLTPASLSYLTQFIIAVLITGYLVIRFGSWRSHQPPHLRLLTAFMTGIALLSLLFLLESALFPDLSLYALYAQNTVLGVSLILLLQFAYRFPEPLPRRREARLVLVLSTLYMLYEASYAVYRYTLLGQGHIVFRLDWVDFPLALGLLWVPIVLARQSIRASRQNQAHAERSGWHYLWRPQGHVASAARALALIYLLPVVLAIATILKSFYFIPPNVYQMSLSVGMMIALAGFTVVYLNFLPDLSSFVVKLVGVMLVTLLAVLGTVGWALTPSYAALYRPVWPPDQQTFRFTPNAQGGYDIAAVPFQFEPDLGTPLSLVDTIDQPEDKTVVKLDFAFPFYGQPYSEVYLSNDGSLGLGRPVNYRDYRYRYGGLTPLIFPLLTDLNPGEGRRDVFARQAADRLIITFDRVPSYAWPQDLFTFQIVLHHSGVFEITYDDLPEPQTYHANDDPMANLWLIGSTPGELDATPQALDIGQLSAGQTIVSGPQGIVQDYYLGLRRQLNELLQPLAWLMIFVSALAVAGFPWLLSRSLVRPLNRLLNGVQQLEAGDYTVNVPVQYHDEIGFLTRAFNSLATQLDDLIHNLSAKVAERTAELSRAKTAAEEQHQIAEDAKAQAEAANVQLEANVRELQARNEELDAFSHTVAHDIRSPVAQMAGVAEMLAEFEADMAPEVRAKSLGMLMRGGEKLTNIIDELLLLAGLRHVEVPLEPLNMATIVNEALTRVQHVLEQTQAQVTLPTADSWPIALGHPAWIEEVWVNYLSNACRYGGVGDQPPRIILGADLTGFENLSGLTMFRFWVRDCGNGIAPDDQSRLFTPFTRLDQVRARGHGLGLSIVRRIVEKLGGEVGVESKGIPGQGSTFSFTLQAAPPDTPLPAAPIAAPATVPHVDELTSLHGVRVLLVDDERLFVESLHTTLTAHGLEVVGVAPDGQQASDLARARQPQIILMDIDMPRVNGLVATRVIKAAWPEVKIVILTASERESDIFEAIRSGADGYLLKGTPARVFYSQLAGLMQGEVPLSPGLARRILSEFARTPAAAETAASPNPAEVLTPQQLDILQRVAHGQTYKEIGAALFLTEATVKYHMGQIVNRLHVKTRTAAVAWLNQPSDK